MFMYVDIAMLMPCAISVTTVTKLVHLTGLVPSHWPQSTPLDLGIINLNWFSRANRIPIEFDSSDRLQGRCQQCMPAVTKLALIRLCYKCNKQLTSVL